MPFRKFSGWMVCFMFGCLTLSVPASSAGCPNSTSGEKEEDCPWAEVARTLISEADSGHPVQEALKKALPKLYSQIQKDAKNTAIRNLWGKSINFDEYAKGIIVHPAILSAIGDTFGIPGASSPEFDSRIVHAGMEHTYGYLFSVLKTPYGYKRARWVRPTIAQGFGLAPASLSPAPTEGTFFSNLTYFFGRIAFRNDAKELGVIKKVKGPSKQVSKNLIKYPYESLKITRLTETVTLPESNRTVVLRTDLIPFNTTPPGQTNTHLLIYSVVDPAQGGARLVTAFPVETSFVEKTLNPENLGHDKPVITRYNAFIEGFSGKELKGKRQVESK